MNSFDDPEQSIGPGSTVAGRYVVETVLGEGGMGRVLRATETRLGRTVALKILHGRLARDADERQRFLREARLTASLSHPNVLQVYEADVWEDHLYIAMEFVDGSNLAELLDGKVPLVQGLDVVAKVAQALAAAHGAGLIHRDLKPENVLVSALVSSAEGMTVKVADWGLARAIEAPQRLTATGVVLGTPAYMPPEQIRGERLGPAVDCYALGVILYRLVAGRLPFPGPGLGKILEGHLRLEPPALTSVRPGCPPALADLVAGLLTKDQRLRLKDAGEVARRLADLGLDLEASPIADLPTRAISSVGMSLPGPGSPVHAGLRSRSGRGPGSSSEDAPTAAMQASDSREGAAGSAAAPGASGRAAAKGAAAQRASRQVAPGASRQVAPGASGRAAPGTPTPQRPGLRGVLGLVALLVVAGVLLLRVGSGSPPAFAVHGLRLVDIDAITVVGSGEPPPGTVLRVSPDDGSAPFEVPFAEGQTGADGGAPAAAAPLGGPAGRRAWTVPLGRFLLGKAKVAVHGPAFEGRDVPSAPVGPGDLPPLAALVRLNEDEVLLRLLAELRRTGGEPAAALADAGLTPAALGWLIGRLPRLLPPQGAPTAPVRRLLLPLLCFETLRHPRSSWLPAWEASLRRLGYPEQALTTDLDDDFRRPLPPVILGRAAIHSFKQGPKDSKPRPRLTWVHSPEQYAAAQADPEGHIATSDRFGTWANAASASADDWQPERRLALPLDGDVWPPVRPIMVLDARYHTHDRILLVSVNGSVPYAVVRPGLVEATTEMMFFAEGAVRYLVPLEPADLRRGDNEVVLRSRILLRPHPFHGTRIEGLGVIDDRDDALRNVAFRPRPPRNTGLRLGGGTDRPEQ